MCAGEQALRLHRGTDLHYSYLTHDEGLVTAHMHTTHTQRHTHRKPVQFSVQYPLTVLSPDPHTLLSTAVVLQRL